jgi:hypothetical protein
LLFGVPQGAEVSFGQALFHPVAPSSENDSRLPVPAEEGTSFPAKRQPVSGLRGEVRDALQTSRFGVELVSV